MTTATSSDYTVIKEVNFTHRRSETLNDDSPHKDHIESFDRCETKLSDVVGEDAALGLIGHARDLAILMVAVAPAEVDQARLTHALDCVRAALDVYGSALDVAVTKKKRLNEERQQEQVKKSEE